MKNHCLIKNQIESFRITSVKRLPIIRFMLLGVLFVLLIPARVFSQTATQPAGYGDSGSPYQIATLENLYWMSANAGSVSQAYCIQTADIDASSTSGWTNGWIPIGGGSSFSGSYDGQGHIISNLTIRSGASSIGWGLFDYLTGSVSNLGLTNVDISGGGSGSGAIAGYATYNLDPNDGITIIPCTITNCYSTGTVTASSLGGGLVGKIDGGTDVGTKGCIVSNCFSSCTVTGTGTDGSEFGGFAGRIAFNAEVTRCYATGSASYIYSAYDAGWVGGFVGGMDNGSYVNNCYARGNATAAAGDYPGGFVGYVADGTVTIDKCYSTGVPSGSSNSGGFSGFGAASYSFWDSQTSGQANSGGGMSKTTAQMKDITTFRNVGWWIDPSTGWAMNASINNGYPYLAPFFTIPTAVPTLTSFTPTSAGNGTTVTITGTNFTGATAVSFGGTAATSKTVLSSTSITAVVASGTSGSVSVTTPGGTATSDGFTYILLPTVSSVNVPTNSTYKTGDNLDFTVNYDQVVTVSGSPRFTVTLNTGGSQVASYLSGSGSTAIVFRYTVVSGNQDNDGISVGSNIALNGGTIQNGSALNASLALNGVASTTGVLVDAIAPTVSSVGVPSNGNYITSQNLDLTVNFSEAVVAVTTGGVPY
ncbi:MAG: IPT/TIG domain-containing protein, partial [Prolixibacteraceae bacterium]